MSVLFPQNLCLVSFFQNILHTPLKNYSHVKNFLSALSTNGLWYILICRVQDGLCFFISTYPQQATLTFSIVAPLPAANKGIQKKGPYTSSQRQNLKSLTGE